MAHTYPAREMSHLRRREPPGASLPQIQRHSGGGSDHLLRELLCLKQTVPTSVVLGSLSSEIDN